MNRIKHGNKIKKFIKNIIPIAYKENVETFIHNLNDFRKIAVDVPETLHEDYVKYFKKYMSHELSLLRIEYKKIEYSYKESVLLTDKQSEKFITRLSDRELSKDMRIFYQKEHMNILKPKFYLEQIKENYEHYLEVLNIFTEEFNEWFFLDNVNFLHQLLQPFIRKDSSGKEIWIYKKYEKEITDERKEKILKIAGLK